MSFKIVLLAPDVDESWPEKIRQAVPGVVAKTFRDPQDALGDDRGRRRGLRDGAARAVRPREGNCAGSAPPAPAWAATGSTTRS